MTTFFYYRLRFLNTSQAQWSFLLKHMCGAITTKNGCNSSLIVELSTLWYGCFQSLFFLCYYFLEFDEFIFCFQDTYNNRLKEKYMDNPSTLLDIDLDLWLKTWLSYGLDTNQVYRLSNSTTKNLRTTRSASTVGCPQLIPSVQTLEFTGMLDQQV